MQELIISRDSHQTRAALLEDGRAVGLHVEPLGRPSTVGNIYKGRVEKVLGGMEAAFVDIGQERNGYLTADDLEGLAGRQTGRARITRLLKGGQEILVRVTRDPMGGKGPRLSMQLLIVGRHLILSPQGRASGASRRLEETERERLRQACAGLVKGEGGVIARTAAEGASEEMLARELRFLNHVWGGIEQRAATVGAPALVYREAELAVRAVRDLPEAGFKRVLVDDARVERRLVSYLRAVAPSASGRVELYRGQRPLFQEYGVEQEIEKALARRVGLPCGGYIVIDHTEAMTVVDVNTGSYVRGRHLEETTVKVNVEACEEIVRQLRLRDIGGIIVIDFIDMAKEANREAVLAALKAELAKDRTKSYVVELSPLGLVEMTRHNANPGLREVVTRRCPVCRGAGVVKSDQAALADVERVIRGLVAASTAPVVRVEVHPRMVEILAATAAHGAAYGEQGGNSPLARLERESGRRVVAQGAGREVPLDHCSLVA